jgi:NAD(P)H dehydrogenase (quinone)
MHTIIITSHPAKNSYTNTVRDRIIDGLKTNQRSTVETIDLCLEGFDPRFTLDDYEFVYGRAPLGDKIKLYQQHIDKADVLILLFPIYWWSMPAMMKGWIDRVFTTGWAFEDDVELGTTRLLSGLKGKVVAIGGSKRATYERRGYLDALNKQVCEGIFEYCGMENLGSELLLPIDEAGKEDGLIQAYRVGRDLAATAGAA